MNTLYLFVEAAEPPLVARGPSLARRIRKRVHLHAGCAVSRGSRVPSAEQFPDFDHVYVSGQLFATFRNRLPPQSRPDYDDFIEWLDLERGEADPLVMVAPSGGQRETDMFEVFPISEQKGENRYQSTFFVHGLRHRGPSAEDEVRRLRPGDALALESESVSLMIRERCASTP